MTPNWTCSKCGTANLAEAKFCGNCGSPMPQPVNPTPVQPQPNAGPYVGQPTPGPYVGQPAPGPYVAPAGAAPSSNRAVISLILGIAGFLCCGPVTAVPGIFVAKAELDAIKSGRAPATQEGMAKVAFWLCIAAAILGTLGWILAILFGLLRGAMG
jgi:hypothetical protein